MTDFSFLDNIQLTEVQPTSTRKTTKAEANPTEADLRLFADGSLYPSLALIKEFNLEYLEDGAEGVELGFDLIDSKFWGMVPDKIERFLAIATVSKHEAPKPMLFGKARKTDGKPVQSVADQGSTASGNLLVEYLNDVYGFEFAEGQEYVDLTIDRTHPIQAANGIYNIPRTVRKGPKAGEVTSTRREGCQIYPISVGQITNVEPDTTMEDELPQASPVEDVFATESEN